MHPMNTSVRASPFRPDEVEFPEFGTNRTTTYTVECADPHRHDHAVLCLLIERMYEWRGGLAPVDTDLHATRPDRITLVVHPTNTNFGTVTLGLDGRDGILADALYPEELDRLRSRGARLCELTRLAMDTRHNTKEVLGALLHLVHIHGRLIHGVTDVVILRRIPATPALPAHDRLQLHRRRTHLPVVNAPAVLLHLELAHMDEQDRPAAAPATSVCAHASPPTSPAGSSRTVSSLSSVRPTDQRHAPARRPARRLRCSPTDDECARFSSSRDFPMRRAASYFVLFTLFRLVACSSPASRPAPRRKSPGTCTWHPQEDPRHRRVIAPWHRAESALFLLHQCKAGLTATRSTPGHRPPITSRKPPAAQAVVAWVPVTSADRIDQVTSGCVDLARHHQRHLVPPGIR